MDSVSENAASGGFGAPKGPAEAQTYFYCTEHASRKQQQTARHLNPSSASRKKNLCGSVAPCEPNAFLEFPKTCAWILLGLSFLLAGPVAIADDGGFPGQDFWRDPGFLQSFMGSYGFATDIEPRVTRQEQELLREIGDLMSADPDAATRRLQQAVTADSSAALDFVLANLHFQRDQLDQAAQRYEIALEKFPGFMRARKNLGMVHLRQGDYSAAARSLTRAIELGGGDSATFGLLGLSRLQQDRPHAAEGAYRQALMLDPENTPWRLGLGQSLLSQERYREAAALLEELIEDHPGQGEYRLHLANAFLGLNEPRRAALQYEVVRRQEQATGQSLATLGDLYLNDSLTGLALEVYLEAIERDRPPSPDRALRAARALADRGAWVETERLVAAIESGRDDTWSDQTELNLLRIRARLSMQAGEIDEAVDLLHRIVERDPLDGASLILLAGHYGGSGEPERAELLFERAARAPGHEAEALRRHAEFLVQRGRLEPAAELLRRAQQIEPREYAAQYLERIENVLQQRSDTR